MKKRQIEDKIRRIIQKLCIFYPYQIYKILREGQIIVSPQAVYKVIKKLENEGIIMKLGKTESFGKYSWGSRVIRNIYVLRNIEKDKIIKKYYEMRLKNIREFLLNLEKDIREFISNRNKKFGDIREISTLRRVIDDFEKIVLKMNLKKEDKEHIKESIKKVRHTLTSISHGSDEAKESSSE